MSWARVDDGLWEHPKFEALRAEGEYEAGFLWLLAISYCGRKGNPRITVAEAAMLLMCDAQRAAAAMRVLASRGLADSEAASDLPAKQNSSYLLHDWHLYRSKNEAKVRAGRKGGENKEKNRQTRELAETKQEVSSDVAPPEKPPSPETRSRSRSRSPILEEEDTRARENGEAKPILGASELEQVVSSYNWQTGNVSPKDLERAAKLYPISSEEAAFARDQTDVKNPKHKVSYWLGVIEGQRLDAKTPRKPRGEDAFRRGSRLFLEQDAGIVPFGALEAKQ